MNLDWKKCRIGNVSLFIENKNCSYRYTWNHNDWTEAEHGSHVVELDEEC